MKTDQSHNFKINIPVFLEMTKKVTKQKSDN